MKVSVITVAYKNSKIVIDLLNSIQKFNDIGDELEVIIVDNSPEDCRIEEAIKIADYKGYKYIPADNRGFGAGNNIGAAVAKGDILAFLNPDIILIEPIFKKILEKFAVDGKLAWIGGQLLTLNRDKAPSFALRHEYEANTLFLYIKWFFEKKKGNFDVRRMFLSGADIFIRKGVFEMIGWFDENIFMFYEEADLTNRVLQLAFTCKIEFCPDIRMIHLEHATTKSRMAEMAQIAVASCAYYTKKHGFDHKVYYRKILNAYRWKYYFDRIFRPEVAYYRLQVMKAMEKYLLESEEEG